MDPDATLQEMRDLVKFYEEDPDGYLDSEDGEMLADRFIALDDWLSRGGFPPREWVQEGV